MRVRRRHGAERRVARADALRQRHDVGAAVPVIAAQELAGAGDAAHDFVVDQQDAVAVADFADARIVAVRRHQRVGRRAADRLHDEGDDALRPLGDDLFLQHVGIFDAALLHREVVAVAIGGRRRHRRHHPHLVGEGVGEHAVAGDGQRAERAAVIGRHARDHLPAAPAGRWRRPIGAPA